MNVRQREPIGVNFPRDVLAGCKGLETFLKTAEMVVWNKNPLIPSTTWKNTSQKHMLTHLFAGNKDSIYSAPGMSYILSLVRSKGGRIIGCIEYSLNTGRSSSINCNVLISPSLNWRLKQKAVIHLLSSAGCEMFKGWTNTAECSFNILYSKEHAYLETLFLDILGLKNIAVTSKENGIYLSRSTVPSSLLVSEQAIGSLLPSPLPASYTRWRYTFWAALVSGGLLGMSTYFGSMQEKSNVWGINCALAAVGCLAVVSWAKMKQLYGKPLRLQPEKTANKK